MTKQLQDHKPSSADRDAMRFTFTHAGKEHTFEQATSAVLVPRFLRANRWRTPMDFEFTVFEEIAGDAALEVIDSMSREEYQQLSRDFREHSRFVTTGESSAS